MPSATAYRGRLRPWFRGAIHGSRSTRPLREVSRRSEAPGGPGHPRLPHKRPERPKYPGIRRHFLAALRKGWPSTLVVNRPGASARRDRLLRFHRIAWPQALRTAPVASVSGESPSVSAISPLIGPMTGLMADGAAAVRALAKPTGPNAASRAQRKQNHISGGQCCRSPVSDQPSSPTAAQPN